MKRHAHFAATESEERASSPKTWLAPEKFVGCLQLMMKVCKHVSELSLADTAARRRVGLRGGWGTALLGGSSTGLKSHAPSCFRIHSVATESEERASPPKTRLAPEQFVGCLQLVMKVRKLMHKFAGAVIRLFFRFLMPKGCRKILYTWPSTVYKSRKDQRQALQVLAAPRGAAVQVCLWLTTQA